MKQYLIILVLSVAYSSSSPVSRNGDSFVSVTQSTSGTYNYFIETPNFTRREQRFEDGRVIGQYTITDEHGHKKTYDYTSGPEGYVVKGPLPVAPVDLNFAVPEPAALIADRNLHLAVRNDWARPSSTAKNSVSSQHGEQQWYQALF